MPTYETRICIICQQPFLFRTTPFRTATKPGKYCSRQCYDSRQGLQVELRFWRLAQRCRHEDWCLYCCWQWQGGTSNGYGAFHQKKGIKERMVPAHRTAWEIFQKRQMPAHLFACHWCNFRSCVNPLHIFPGTPQMNTQHAVQCGLFPIGNKNGMGKLSDENIITIRTLVQSGLTQGAIARIFYVGKTTIHNAVHRKSYKHIT